MEKRYMTGALKRIIILLGFLLFITSLIYGTQILINKNILLVDEFDHYDQIMRFERGILEPNESISALRGYHFFVALILRFFHTESTSFLRYLVLGLNSLLIVAVYLAVKMIDKKEAAVKTLQAAFLPIAFPFFTLMYIDVFSEAIVIFFLYLSFRKNYFLSQALGVLSLFIKQTNVIWLVFANVIMYVSDNGWNLTFTKLKKHFSKSWVFLLGLSFFIGFVIVNGGVAVVHKGMHPLTISNFGNIYFLLFLLFFLFLPLNISNFPKVLRFLKKNVILFFPMIIWFFVFMTTFSNDHPFNQSQWFLRNRILIYLTSDVILKSVFFVIACYSALSITVTKLVRPVYYLLYPTTILLLMPESLIEQRYYLISMTLFILFRKEESRLVSYLTILIWVVASLVILNGVVNYKHFL